MLRRITNETQKVIREIKKLNSYIELYKSANQSDQTTFDMEKLERESKLVRRIKPMLSQRSYSLERLNKIDLLCISEQERT